MSMPAISDDDPPPPPPPAAHCRLTPTLINDDAKPLDLSKKQIEQGLNLSSKRKRTTPISLSKRNNPSSSPPIPTPSMFIPFYPIPPSQQDIFQQMQTFYLQLQQKLTKNE